MALQKGTKHDYPEIGETSHRMEMEIYIEEDEDESSSSSSSEEEENFLKL